MMTGVEEIRTEAAAVAEKMRTIGKEPVPRDLRKRFIEVRSALFQRGIFDPVLARFDSATVPRATPAEVAEQLAAVAGTL